MSTVCVPWTGETIRSPPDLIYTLLDKTSTLDQLQALRQSGALPQNVNYAVKIDYVIPLLRSQFGEDWKMPDVPSSRRIPELVREAEQSVVLVIAK